MKVELLRDVLISNTEVGTSGQVVSLPDDKAKAFIKKGHAKEAKTDKAAEKEEKAVSSTKEDKADRKTKEAK